MCEKPLSSISKIAIHADSNLTFMQLQLVWTEPASGKMDENFRIGVANCAAFCACLSVDYHLSSQARTEITFAVDCSKIIILLILDDEAREQCWLQPVIHGRQRIDFISEEYDDTSTEYAACSVSCRSLHNILGTCLTTFMMAESYARSSATEGRMYRRNLKGWVL